MYKKYQQEVCYIQVIQFGLVLKKKKKKGKNLGKSFFKKNSYLVNKSN